MERSDGGRRLLVWDAPDMDRCLSEVLGQRASVTTRPNLPAVLRWARERSGRPECLEAAVFCVVPHGLEAKMAPWVANLRHHGFAVFAKPTPARRDAVTRDLVRHVQRSFAQGRLVQVVVASHEVATLREPLRRWRAAGVDVALLGYRERDGFATVEPAVTFVDVEEVPGAFDQPLPRTNLFDLPQGGRWFDPLAGDESPPSGNGRSTATARGTATASAGLPTTATAVSGASASATAAAGAPGADVASAGRPDAGPPADPTPAPAPADASPRPSNGTGNGEVLALVEAEVAAAQAAGSPGLTLRHVGDLIRARFEQRTLAELGFESVGRLVEQLEAAGQLRLIRVADGCHLLTLAACDPPTPPSDGPWSDAPPPDAPPTPRSDAPAPDDPPSEDRRPGATVGHPDPRSGEDREPTAGPASDPAPAADPTPAAAIGRAPAPAPDRSAADLVQRPPNHPFYRAFLGRSST
jgi:uncharacterized protein